MITQRVLPVFQTTVAPGQTSLLLQPLLSDTEYRITLTPVYQQGDGPSISRLARTRTERSHNSPVELYW